MSDDPTPEITAAAARGHLLAASADALAVQARELLIQIFAEAPEEERQALDHTNGVPLLILAAASAIVTKADGDVQMMDTLTKRSEIALNHDVSLCHLRRLITLTRGSTVVTEAAEAVH